MYGWRGTIGLVKPTFRPGPLEAFIRFMPAGVCEEIYARAKKLFRDSGGGDCLYLLGAGWNCLEAIAPLERDLNTSVLANVPAERVKALREGFMKLMRDPDVAAEARKKGLDPSPVSGEELEGLVKQLSAQTPEVIHRMKTLLQK